eukprot:m.132144 g.132144  ORF g.132144 m.132144 type:complete len:202 (+) comp13085_c0_seq8:63-668(+)
MSKSKKTIESKVVLLGAQSVGKTSLVVRYVEREFHDKCAATVGACFFTKKVNIGPTTVKLQIWDTAGEERFRTMAPMYYRGANAALLVYNVTESKSLEDAKEWLEELRDNTDTCPAICLVANKVDLVTDATQHNVDAGKEFAKSVGASFFATSAKTDTGVEEAFVDVVKQIVEEQDKDKEVNEKGKIRLSDAHDKKKEGCC